MTTSEQINETEEPQGRIAPGTTCHSRAEFVAVLRAWLQNTQEQTIGEVENFGGKAWIRLVGDVPPCHLNVDTHRSGVERFLRLVDEHGADLEWHVVGNNRGQVNRIAFGPRREKLPKFYLYTDAALQAPRAL